MFLVSERILSVMYNHTLFLCMQITRLNIRPSVKWDLSLVTTADGHFNLPQGFEWEGKHSHFITNVGGDAFQMRSLPRELR